MIKTVPPIHRYLSLIMRQTLSRQTLERVPEASAVTDQSDHVLQYDEVMTTKLAIAYAVALEAIYRARMEPFGGKATDLACGPGHFALGLAKYLRLDFVEGIDLSAPMIETAAKNAREQNITNVVFHVGDVTQLRDVEQNSFDLCTFCDAAHHMSDLENVTRVISEMDRITKPSGLLFIMDLARLKTASLTDSYVTLLGTDYCERGLSSFYEDFYHSMYAAWTVEELGGTIPVSSNRRWYQLIPRGLPTIQLLFGIPTHQPILFRRRGFPWSRAANPLNALLRPEWQLMRQSLSWGKVNAIQPACPTITSGSSDFRDIRAPSCIGSSRE